MANSFLSMPAFRNANDIIASVSENAKQDLIRLQALPPSSHKWTWGEQLTEAKVLALCHSGTQPKHQSHSGYDLSLNHGISAGVDSSLPSMPKSFDGQHDSQAESASALPEYTFPDLYYFKKKWNMLYDPLGKTRVIISPAEPSAHALHTQAKLTSENLNLHTELLMNDIAEEWSSNGRKPSVGIAKWKKPGSEDDETPAKGIENDWKLASGDEALAKGIENEWKSASGGENPAELIENDDDGEKPAEGIEDIWVLGSDELSAMGQDQ